MISSFKSLSVLMPENNLHSSTNIISRKDAKTAK